MTKRFFSPLENKESSGSENQARVEVCEFIANKTIFALGVALIEISFGTPILSLKDKADPECPGFPGSTEYFIAMRLVNQDVIRKRDGDMYAEVVLRCVKGLLNTGTSRLDFDNMKSFYEDVVLPLQRVNQVLCTEKDVGIT